MKIVVCSGGYDPIHSGHIAYFEAARQLGDQLVVGVNSDDWLERKKGRAFMPWRERAAIIGKMRMVDRVVSFNDDDGSACALLERLKHEFPYATIIFANGGDRTATNIPEMSVKDIVFKFGVGGEDKANSSSWILQEWKSPMTSRICGYYRVLHEVTDTLPTKLKELTVEPGCSLSMQRHDHRAEIWFVAEGTAEVYTMDGDRRTLRGTYRLHDYLVVERGEWHQLVNSADRPLKIIEIQYGTACDESDIERKPL